MRRLITLLLIIPALAVGQSRFGHGGVSVSSLLPIIADSTLWHLQGTDTLVTDGALPIKVPGIRVTGNARLDGNLTLITTAAESLVISAGGIRNEGGLLQKGAATFGATGTQATIATTGKITTPDTLVSTLGIRTEGPATIKGNIDARTKAVIGDSLRVNKTTKLIGNVEVGTGTEWFSAEDSTLTISGLSFKPALFTVVDDDSVLLTPSVSGCGTVMAGDNEEFAYFRFTSAGDVTLINNSAKVSKTAAAGDDSLMVYDAGSGVAIKNRLGGTKKISLNVMGFSP